MSSNNPFFNKDLLRSIEANNNDYPVSILMLLDRVGRALENDMNYLDGTIIALEVSHHLRRIEANDPDLRELISIVIPRTNEVSYALFDRVGRALANSTLIRDLELYIPSEDNVDLAGWNRFFELISGNRSIRRFTYRSQYKAERVVRLASTVFLRRFFESNDALEELTLIQINHEEAEEIASALASRETALDSITVYDDSLQILRLIFEKNPAALPKKISARHTNDAEGLAQYLESERNVNIHELYILDKDLTPRGIQRIARALALRDSPLQKIEVIRPSTMDTFLVNLATEFLINPDSFPNKFEVHFPVCIDGCNVLGNVLVRRMAPLEYLRLQNEGEGEEVDAYVTLFRVLSRNPSKTPKCLENVTFDNVLTGYIEEILRNQMCPMEELFFATVEEDTECINFQQRITTICCNEASINATYFSNHTLRQVDSTNFEMNVNPDKKQVARSKVCATHLARNFQPDFFEDMKPSLLSEVFPFVNQAFVDHEELTSGAGATTDGNVEPKQVTNNNLSIHFMLIKNHLSLFNYLLVNKH